MVDCAEIDMDGAGLVWVLSWSSVPLGFPSGCFGQHAVDDLFEDLVGLGAGKQEVADEEGGYSSDAQADGLAVLGQHLLAVVA